MLSVAVGNCVPSERQRFRRAKQASGRGTEGTAKMGEVIRKMKDGRFIGYYIRWVDSDGKRKMRASKQPTITDAKRMLVEIEARVARGKLGVAERPARLSIGQLLDRFYMEYDPPRARSRSAWESKIRSQLVTLLPQLAGCDAGSFSIEDAERLRHQLTRQGYKGNTVRLKLTFLCTAFEFGRRKGIVLGNPFAGLRKPRAEHRVEYLTADEVRQLLSSVDARTDVRGRVLAVAVRLAIYAGLRVGEVFGLRWRDIDVSRGVLTVSRSYEGTTKSGKPRHIPMADELAEVIHGWRSACPETKEGVVCPVISDEPGSTWHAVKCRRPELTPLYAAAGIPTPASPWHSLRHTFASHFLMNGGGLLTLQKLLGHCDLKMTSIYAHLSSDHVAAEVRRVSFLR